MDIEKAFKARPCKNHFYPIFFAQKGLGDKNNLGIFFKKLTKYFFQETRQQELVIDVCRQESIGQVSCQVENMSGISMDFMDIDMEMVNRALDPVWHQALVSGAVDRNNNTPTWLLSWQYSIIVGAFMLVFV